jgi:hypothetical protein
VVDGVFTVDLDFGDGAFQGDARWLEIAVCCPTGCTPKVTLDPRQPLTPAPYALALPGLWTQQNATSPNLVGGYSGNEVTEGVVGATIGGGGSGDANCAGGSYPCLNRVNGPYSTVGGGEANLALGDDITIGGGWKNMAVANYDTVGGGRENDVSADYATVAGGYANIATASGTTVPGGQWGRATHYGEMAYASGAFVVGGDAQTSVYVLRNQTTSDGVWEELFLDGAGQRLTVENDRTVTFDILIAARSDGGESAGYHCYGSIEREGIVTGLLYGSCTAWGEDDTTWNVRVQADDVEDALSIQVLGHGETIRWVASVRTAEVYNP